MIAESQTMGAANLKPWGLIPLVNELIENNRDALAEKGRDFVSENPGVEPVGLILEAGASEAKPFLDALEQAARESRYRANPNKWSTSSGQNRT